MSFSPRERAGAKPPDPEQVRQELERMLASEPFSRSERHRNLLRFLVEETLAGRQAGLKELVLATEVFGRDTSFDSRINSVVRVEARNLRARINEYSLGEGSGGAVRIELPKGTYVPVFQCVEKTSDAAAPPPHRAFTPTRAVLARPVRPQRLAAAAG